jgi:DNA polymerase III epsilon subunit-like protein
MPQAYEILERSFHAGAVRERGEIVLLRDDERPGEHMRLHQPPRAAPIVPRVVDALPGAPVPALTPAPAPQPSPAPAAVAPAPVKPVSHLSIGERLAAAMGPAPEAQPYHPGYVIIDTETNALKDPRLAAVALIFADRMLNVEYEYARLVRPDGWEMEPEALKVNGLSMDLLERRGCNVLEPLIVFEIALSWGRTIVCHNAEFDMRVMRGELRRALRGSAIVDYNVVCTMLAARRMVGSGKLESAYEALMNEPLVGAHDAMTDARACHAVLRKLRERGLDVAKETKRMEA